MLGNGGQQLAVPTGIGNDGGSFSVSRTQSPATGIGVARGGNGSGFGSRPGSGFGQQPGNGSGVGSRPGASSGFGSQPGNGAGAGLGSGFGFGS
jgi:hypothetical protein